ncbi:MAG: DsbE family thiol:disulfide interchange protein [Gammaproteobacteria bacterium]
MKFFIPVILFVGLLLIFARGLELDPSYVPSPLIGKPAPEFTLPRLLEPEATLGKSDMLGSISLFNVWATWCVGCREEHDTLIRIASESGIPIYGLNWKDEIGLAQQWLAQLGNPYVANAVDIEGTVAIDWGVYGAPETFLLDANGQVVYKHLSPMTMDVWNTEFLPRIQQLQEGS